MKNQPGIFCWNDLRTTDLASASKFYQGLFHWDFRDSKTADQRDYRVAKVEDQELGGIYTLQPETVSSGIPPHWLPYVSVDDARDAVAKARGLGAEIVKEPFDFGKDGVIAVLRDPVGALIGLWQPKAFSGHEPSETAGTPMWMELHTRDLNAATRFYQGLFGWSAERKKYGEIDYTLFKLDGQEVAGLMEPMKPATEAPAHWTTYFLVQDCGTSTALAKKLGAEVLADTQKIQDVGLISMIRDPQDAVFGIVEPKMARTEAA